MAETDRAGSIAVHPCTSSLDFMGTLETDDAGLRQLVHEHPKAIAMFTADHCATCEHLRPIFELFATNKAYADILFLRLDANQSPVAKRSMQQQHAPLFVTYDQGRLLHCDTLHTEQQLRALLHGLHQHA
jgi:thioredoxin 1